MKFNFMKFFYNYIIFFQLLLLSTKVMAQSPTCNIQQLDAAMAQAGFVPLNVVGYPCAKYYYNPSTTSNWNTASSQASAIGATLLTICDQAENDAVLLAANNAGVTGGLWIGYTDAATEGTWLWLDGSPCSFTNWNPGEPNNTSDICSSAGEDVAIMQMNNGKWNDVYANPGFPCISPAQYASLVKVNLCPVVTSIASASLVCEGDPVQLSASTLFGSPTYAYSWVNSSNQSVGTGSNVTINPNTTNTYVVTSTDLYGCSALDTITVSTQNCSPQLADVCCPYTGWGYVQPLTITNNTPVATTANLQTLVILDTQTPISQGKMLANGNDIRFVYESCGNYLDYYIESSINTNQTNIWVKMPVIPANGSIMLYLYYGNNTAAPGSIPFTGATGMFPSVLTVTGTQNLSGTQNYDWIDVQAGANITMTSLQPVVLQARRIVFNGNFDGLGQGYAPQSGPGSGSSGNGSVGGGGGGYGAAGGGGGNANGGAANGTATGIDIDFGSGGGNSDCNAAAGGGAITLRASSITLNGNINVTGNTNASSCGEEAGGGGSGGGILVVSEYLNGTGLLEAKGGQGQSSNNKEGGGGGSGGRIKLFWSSLNTFSGTLSVAGGLAGSGGQSGMQPGGNGTSVQPQVPGITQTFAVEVPVSIPTANFAAQNVCVNSLTSFNDQSSVQASGSITQWSWDFDDGSTSTSQNPTHAYATAGTYDVTFIVTTATGCTDQFIGQVIVNEGAVAGFTASNVCIGDSIIFNNTSSNTATSWVWNFGDGNNSSTQSPSHTYNSPGTYTVSLTVQTSNGCVSITTNPVTVYALPNIQAGSPVTICLGQSTSLNATGGTSYIWIPSITNGQSISPNQTTNYSVIGTDANGCQDSSSTTITVLPIPVASFSSDLITGPPGSTATFLNSSLNGLTYNWDFGNGATNTITTLNSQTATYPLIGTYNVVLQATNGYCSDVDSVQITIIVPTLELFVPNVFTVNNDSINNVWSVQTINASSSKVQIFNRWGNLVTELNQINESWDGKVSGSDATSGVYFYKYEVVDLYGVSKKGHGHFTLIRD